MTQITETARTHKISSGDVTLFAKESGNRDNPALLFLHGVPDDHQVWSNQFQYFSQDYHVISFDLRGMGQSSAPEETSGYQLQYIMQDIESIIKYFRGEHEKVHLIGHDWGSTIGWQFTADPAYGPDFIESYVSLSGPHAGIWNELSFNQFKSLKIEEIKKALGQYAKSWYIGFFQIPVLPDRLLKAYAGALARYLLKDSGVKADDPYLQETYKAGFNQTIVNGIELYRNNFLPPAKAPAKASIDIPILQLVPTEDKFLDPSLYQSTANYCNNLTLVSFEAGHWAQRQYPERIIQEMTDFYKKLTPST